MSAARAPVQAAQEQEDWLTTQEAGALVKVAVQTLANWRSLGIGPAYTKLTDGRAGRIRYRRCDVLRWLADRQVA